MWPSLLCNSWGANNHDTRRTEEALAQAAVPKRTRHRSTLVQSLSSLQQYAVITKVKGSSHWTDCGTEMIT